MAKNYRVDVKTDVNETLKLYTKKRWVNGVAQIPLSIKR